MRRALACAALPVLAFYPALPAPACCMLPGGFRGSISQSAQQGAILFFATIVFGRGERVGLPLALGFIVLLAVVLVLRRRRPAV